MQKFHKKMFHCEECSKKFTLPNTLIKHRNPLKQNKNGGGGKLLKTVCITTFREKYSKVKNIILLRCSFAE